MLHGQKQHEEQGKYIGIRPVGREMRGGKKMLERTIIFSGPWKRDGSAACCWGSNTAVIVVFVGCLYVAWSRPFDCSGFPSFHNPFSIFYIILVQNAVKVQWNDVIWFTGIINKSIAPSSSVDPIYLYTGHQHLSNGHFFTNVQVVLASADTYSISRKAYQEGYRLPIDFARGTGREVVQGFIRSPHNPNTCDKAGNDNI